MEQEVKTDGRAEQIKPTHVDFLFNLAGIVGLSIFCFIVYAIVFITVPEQNRDLWIHMIGICEGIVFAIFGYLFGSAISRNIKN